MQRMAIVGFVVLVFLVGCAHVKPSPSPTSQSATNATPPAVAASPSVAPAPEKPAASATPASGADAARTLAMTSNAPPTVATVPAAQKARGGEAAKVPPSRTGSTGPSPAAAPRAASPASPPSAAAAPQKPAASLALDLAAMEQRLRDTRAIGVFTKLALKNQVDDLLNTFRAYHGGRLKATLAELRQRYEALLLKVLSLLQDGDPPLAAAISASRDTIWGILTDPEKLQKV